MKAIKIDATARTVTEIEITKDYREISKNIGCDCFTSAGTCENNDTLYVDDEGLLTDPQHFFYLPSFYPTPLAGNGMILGCDEEGESTDSITWVEVVRKDVSFFTTEELRSAIDSGSLKL